ncbi:hypothetical protein KKC60_01170 [Patescibacteria group bacterium]|nr:hypothetical protein [Patescibacteria group bacterium]
MAKKTLQENILETIAFFDIFDYPLTETEVHKWLWQRESNFLEVQEALEGLLANQKLGMSDGLFFLPSRKKLVQERKAKYLVAEKKYKKIKRATRLLKMLPFIRLVAACNTLLILDFKEESDLDLFIVVKKNRLFMTRFLTTVLIALSGSWRHGKKTKDQICLSFYVTDDHLDLSPLALKDGDPYLTYWLTFLVPILDRSTYSRFLRSNDWIKNYLPQAQAYITITRRRVLLVGPLEKIRKLAETILAGFLGNWLERFFKKLQQQKMKKRELLRKDQQNDVIISDQVLKFHEQDRRRYYREVWQKNRKRILSQ